MKYFRRWFIIWNGFKFGLTLFKSPAYVANIEDCYKYDLFGTICVRCVGSIRSHVCKKKRTSHDLCHTPIGHSSVICPWEYCFFTISLDTISVLRSSLGLRSFIYTLALQMLMQLNITSMEALINTKSTSFILNYLVLFLFNYL
jgi:hypothetical protein